MAIKIDLSKPKREDIPIVSLAGTTYLIPGNFKTEYTLKLIDTMDKVNDAKAKNDVQKTYSILKQWVYELLCMNIEGTYIDDESGKEVKVTHKKVTKETVEKEFNDYQVIELLLSEILAIANE